MSNGTVNLTDDQAPRSVLDQAGASPTHMLLDDNILSNAEKRDILASWASDKRAVADQPSLRVLDDGAIISVDDVHGCSKVFGLCHSRYAFWLPDLL